MTCETFVGKDGVRMIVCGRGHRAPKPKPCAACGTETAGYVLCDFKISEPVIRGGQQTRRARTCDKPLCKRCAVHVGEDIDYCPSHPLHAAAPVQGAFEL